MKTTSIGWLPSGAVFALAGLIGLLEKTPAQETVPVIAPLDLGAALDQLVGTPVHSLAVAANDLGQVVVNNYSGDGHAYLWSAEGGFQDLGTLGGNRCQGMAINSVGQVVGTSETSGWDCQRLFLHDAWVKVPTKWRMRAFFPPSPVQSAPESRLRGMEGHFQS